MTFSSSMKLVMATISMAGFSALIRRDRREPVHVRHQQVHQDDVRLEPAGHRDALAAVGGLADDVDVVEQVEERAKPRPDDGMVVDEQDADRLLRAHGLTSPDRVGTAVGEPGPESTARPAAEDRDRWAAGANDCELAMSSVGAVVLAR